ncbi:MAG: GAF domain-containing protein [Anaerolineae bacterium]|nr:GAF domain-containing protein [Anaerolineae bacterium]
MAYLLILPICLYTVLVTVVLQRRPRGILTAALAVYLISAITVTAALLLMGTTSNQTAAEWCAVIIVLVFSWAYQTFLPLTLIGLYFESWFRMHWRSLFGATVVISLIASALILWSASNNSLPLVIEVDTGFWMNWLIGITEYRWYYCIVMVFASQFTAITITGFALYQSRLTLWNGAVPLMLASLGSILFPILAPLAGEAWAVTITALGYVPPVLLLTLLVIRHSYPIPLEPLLESMLGDSSEGAIVLDSYNKVIWKNAQITRWLGPAGQLSAITPPHMVELLRGTPFVSPVRKVLYTGVTSECEVELEGEERVIRVDHQPLDVPRLPNAQLITFRDITALRMRERLDRRREEFLALSTISTDISSSLEMSQVIERALTQIVSITQLDAAAVYLIDENNSSQLKLAGNLITVQETDTAPETLPIEGSTAGRVIRTHQTIITPDAAQDDEIGPRMLTQKIRAGITIPLTARSRVIGVLQGGNHEPRDYATTEVAILSNVARQLAIAIDNARLHSQERQQRQIAETLREVASILISKNLDDALTALLEQLARILDYDRASVLLLAEPGKLRIGAYAGFKSPLDSESLKTTRIEVARYAYLLHLFTQHAPQFVADTTTDLEWQEGLYSHGSWIGAPLIVHGQVLGCLSITHDEPGRFTEADLHIVSAFADQAAVAVENAQLFESEQRRRFQAEHLQHASYDLVTSPDLDSALDAALKNLANVLPYDRAHIGLLDENGKTWTPRAGQPLIEPLPSSKAIPLDAYPLIKRAVLEKKPLFVPDTNQNKWWRPGRFSKREVRCWIGVPLIVRDRVIGFMNVDSFQPHHFTEAQFQNVHVFANQIAAAIDNFRLLEEASRQNRALQALNTILAASNEVLTQENLLHISLERILETLNLHSGVIHRRDVSKDRLVLQAAVGLPEDVIDLLSHFPLADKLPDVSLADGEDYAFFSVPLVSHGTEIGLLSIRQVSPFEPWQQTLLANIGQQLGVVMDNAFLFENAVRREALSTDLGRLSLTISAQLNRTTVLDLICRESIAVFNAHGAYIWLLEGTRLVNAAAHGPGANLLQNSSYHLDDEGALPVRIIREWQVSRYNPTENSRRIDSELAAITNAQAVLAVPLIKADMPIGTLLLTHTQNPDAFADCPPDQIGLLGVQAALAIQNVTLFDEVRRRLDQLRLVNEVGRYAAAILNPPDLIEGVAQRLSRTLGYEIISLLQVEEKRLFISSVFIQERPTPVDRLHALRPPLESTAQQAIRRGEPVLEDQTLHFEHDVAGLSGEIEYCALAVPLIVADEVIGVLVVQRRGHRSIRQEDLDVLEPLAAQLAISVSNARLFEKVRQQTIELEARVEARTAEIRQQQERTEAILRSVADAVIVFDLAGQVIMTNPVAKVLFDQHDLNMDLGTRIGKLVAQTLESEDRTSATEIIELGPVALQAKAARVVEDGKVLGTVVVLRDISRLQELDRMKDNFVSNVSHELRTPLANLKLYLSLLQQGRPERRASYLEVMEREVERLARLISDLLDLSRLQSEIHAERPPVREPINIESLIDTVIHDNIARAENEHKTLGHTCLGSPLPWIIGDPDQIVRALTNLIDNALNYTPDHGHIAVHSRSTPGGQQGREWVIIDVTDTGIGIPENETSVIFDRFFRGSNIDPNVSGTGLGLAIIKEIVELHGGSVEVESQVNQGSTFHIKLPAINPNNGGSFGGSHDQQ